MLSLGMSLAGARVTGQAVSGVVGGVSLVCGSCTEREKASVEMAYRRVVGLRGRERERAEAETEGIEYRCGARRRTGS